MKHDKKREKKGFCQLCGEHGITHIHHVFGGSRRGVSERYDFVIELCPNCHSWVHASEAANERLKMKYQRIYEQTHTRAQWMKLMGRNWL